MRKRDRREFARYVRLLADEAGLRDWTITVQIGDPSAEYDRYDAENIAAVMEPVPGQKLGVVTFPEACRDWDREKLRSTVLHELVHCHFGPVWEVCLHLMSLLGPTATQAASKGAELDMEHAVDGIAMEWARHLPLIDWP